MLKYLFISIATFSFASAIDFLFFQNSHENESPSLFFTEENSSMQSPTPVPTIKVYSIDSFFEPDAEIGNEIELIMQTMTAPEKAGMVLMPAWEKNMPLETMITQKNSLYLGGVFVLRNDFTVSDIQQLKKGNTLPLLVSVDAEPSLLYKNFTEIDSQIENTNQLITEEKAENAAKNIAKKMKEYGFNINFAPVYDSGENTAIIGNRAFGKNDEDIQRLATAFSKALKKQKVFSTAKHFPGHGNVAGDSHYILPTIDGELTELENFQYAIDQKIPIMMVGHIAVRNNRLWGTDGLPSSVSAKITTELLRKKLGFEGLIITDAMNMAGVAKSEDAEIEALKAGSDIILMPKNIIKTHELIVQKIMNDAEFSEQINNKVERILKMKLLLQKL